ncbi:MAG: ketopantoate reductase family protein [Bdellovibrionales bacterium]|nr:ketopantoate reductase family protein [Bdellovibrionales bacterium]
MNVAIVGAGAVGATVGAWLAPHHENLWLVDLPEVAAKLRASGITSFLGEKPSEREPVKVKVVDSLTNVPSPDLVILCVKNYSLDSVARKLREQLGDSPIVLGLQNGVENQKILPKHFSKVVYGIVAYNAWLESVGVVGYQKKGPLVLGVVDSALNPDRDRVAALLGKGMPIEITDRLADAAHSKMIVNLTNSLTTLIGHPFQPVADRAAFQKLLTSLTSEGVEIARASGFREVKMGGMPSWLLMRAAARLPRFLTRGAFEKNVRKMVMSSMAQDILQRGGTDSELESLNGYFVNLADRAGVRAPINRAIYRLCKERFSRPGFKPMDVTEVLREVAR